jgi:hypothetical protein
VSLMLNSLVTASMDTHAWFNRIVDNKARAEGSIHYVTAGKTGSFTCFGNVKSPASIVRYIRRQIRAELL